MVGLGVGEISGASDWLLNGGSVAKFEISLRLGNLQGMTQIAKQQSRFFKGSQFGGGVQLVQKVTVWPPSALARVSRQVLARVEF